MAPLRHPGRKNNNVRAIRSERTLVDNDSISVHALDTDVEVIQSLTAIYNIRNLHEPIGYFRPDAYEGRGSIRAIVRELCSLC